MIEINLPQVFGKVDLSKWSKPLKMVLQMVGSDQKSGGERRKRNGGGGE